MRRISRNPNKKEHVLRRLEVERFLRRLNSKRKKSAKNRSNQKYIPSKYEVQVAPRGLPRGEGWADLRLPAVLDLIKNYNETIDFIRAIRHTALVQKRRVRLLFDEAKSIKPAALLLLLAEIHQCRLVRGANQVTGTYPKEPRLERMMDSTGFFKLLGVQSRLDKKKPSSKKRVEYIEFVSDIRLAREAARRLRESLLGDDLSMNIVARKKLFRAISEAMINVGQHAYPSEFRREPAIHGRWWLAGTISKGRNELMITFCDLGVGIPRTLPKLYAWEKIRSVLALLPGINPNDAQMIQAGMTIGRTQTGETNRGKGLNDLRSFIDQSGGGEMHVFSRHGMYRYSSGGAEYTANYDHPVQGTLIKWSVPLDRVTNWTYEDIDDESHEDN